MTRGAWTRSAFCALAALLGSGCYLHNEGDDAGPRDGAPDMIADGAVVDGSTMRDGSSPDGSAACLTWGETRVCGDYCEHLCPPMHACSEYYHICRPWDSGDPRGDEKCGVDLGLGRRYCYSGALCAAIEPRFDPETGSSNSGTCVDEGYCRWVRDGHGPPDVRCRYSEGQPYEDGPPDVPCGTGALPGSGFCGGRCGDTCRANYNFGPPSCVGLSEERGFGVCAQRGARCTRENALSTLGNCEQAVNYATRDADNTCACMVLEPPLSPDLADRGWGVALETCLAYRDAFPDQVRCMDETWAEL